jgi:hypothetical protein
VRCWKQILEEFQYHFVVRTLQKHIEEPDRNDFHKKDCEVLNSNTFPIGPLCKKMVDLEGDMVKYSIGKMVLERIRHFK